MVDAHELCGHGGLERIGRYVAKHYYIPNMHTKMKEIKKCCDMCKCEHPSWIPNPLLHPCEVGPAPRMVYSIDLIPDQRRTEKGHTQIVVCVDCFSKHVILGCIPDRKSLTLAEWFYREVINRRGVPMMVRSDNGAEWGMDFMALL